MNVLIVEDTPSVLRTYSRIIRRGFPEVDVVSCLDPIEAAAKLEPEAFDVILSDFNMPGMDGLQLLDLASRLCPAAVRILCTGAHSDVLVHRSEWCKVQVFLRKPVDQKDLVQTLRTFLS